MPLEPNRRIGAYEILGQLGAGGMGEVYRARDTRLGRVVALKILSADLHADPAARERLEREAQLASSLNHPSIVTVFDVGEAEGHPYIVMEMVEGESLYRRLLAGPLKLRHALDIACQVADGLAAAHNMGVVHRDLKPQNIMLTADGRAKIVDFGLSKLTPGAAGPDEATAMGRVLTEQHAILGSAGYMAPEQVAGHIVDARADQFALGAVMYEMLSGQRAFRRDTSVQTMAAIIEDDPPPLSEAAPSVPPHIAVLIERCLAKRPERRYASTYDLARDLHDARDTVSGTRPLPPLPRQRRVAPGWWAAVAALVIAAVALAVGLREGSFNVSPLSRSAQEVRQIVVMPFVNVTRDAADQVFCDGLVETLTSSLSQLERYQRTLRVVPASEVRREQPDSVKAAHKAFGATLVISGSFQRTPTSIRLTLNLVDAQQLQQLASRTIDVMSGNDASTQDIVVQAAATLLDLQLEPEARSALTAGGTHVSAAYEDYVSARGYLQRFDRSENVDRAIELFVRAIGADPKYALAHAGLGEAYWRKYEVTRDPAWIDRAIGSCGEALKIDDRLAPVHVTLALIARGRGRYEEAVAVAGRAVEIDPVSSEGYRELARAYESLNRLTDAEQTYRKAVAARPDDWLSQNALGSFLLARGRPAEAEPVFQQVVKLTPDNTRAYNNLGSTLFALHRTEEAAAMWEKSASIRPTYVAASNLGTYYFNRGRYAESARAFERAVRITDNDFRVWRNLGAALYWAPGERNKAAAAYQRAIELAEEALTINPRQPDLLAQLADAYTMVDRDREAREAARAVESLSPQDATVLFMLAGVYEQLGERSTALAWLQKAMAAGYARDRIEHSPGLAELRKDPRFARLTR